MMAGDPASSDPNARPDLSPSDGGARSAAPSGFASGTEAADKAGSTGVTRSVGSNGIIGGTDESDGQPGGHDGLAPGPLTVWRDVLILTRQAVANDSSPDAAKLGQLRRLGAYIAADGPREALRKATTRRAGVGQHGRRVRVQFEAAEMVRPDGSVATGRWSGEAVGQVLEDDASTELIAWHYRVAADDNPEAADLADYSLKVGDRSNAGHDMGTGHVGLVGAGAYMHNIVVPSLLAAGVAEFTVTDASLVRARALAKAINGGLSSSEAADQGRPVVHIVSCPMAVVGRAGEFAGVVIACAHSHHERYAATALTAGGRVLVEKPAATTGSGLEALIDVWSVAKVGEAPTTGDVSQVVGTSTTTSIDSAPSVGASLHVGHNRRFARDRIGLVTDEWPRYFSADIEGFPLDDLHWYLAPGEGGRTLGNLTHWLDLSLMVFDEQVPTRLRAEPLAGLGVAITLDFGDGGSAEVRLSDVGPRVMGGRERLTLRTRSRTTTIDDWSRVSEMTATGHHTRRRRRDRGHRSMYLSWFESLPQPTSSNSHANAADSDQRSHTWPFSSGQRTTGVAESDDHLGELVRSHHLAFVARDVLETAPGQWIEVAIPLALQRLR